MPYRRVLALLVVLLIAGFVFGTAWDACDEDGESATACHAACASGCAPALVVGVEAAAVWDHVRIVAVAVSVDRPLSRSAEPEPRPPRA